jgi:hypothetical protein
VNGAAPLPVASGGRTVRRAGRILAAAWVFLVGLNPLSAQEAWREKLQPSTPGNFPAVRPFEGEFRFGWSNVGAARAKAKFRRDGQKTLVTVEGGTTGLARRLWRLDATHRAVVDRVSFFPVAFSQTETYAKKKIQTEAVAKPDGLWYIRRVPTDPGNRPRWKRVKVAPVRDIVSSMLFLRSLPLGDGETIGLLAFPGDSPFLVEVTVERRETIRWNNADHPAIRLSFTLRRIDTKNGNQLVTHGKFRRGTVWVSDDANRLPLRAEVEIFVGCVFGELTNIRFTGP